MQSATIDNKRKRTIVITGGTGGIGLQSAIGIANKDPACRVIVTGRNEERGETAVKRIMEESGNQNVELVIGDVASIQGVDALAEKLSQVTASDGIDVLVNNAGYLGHELQKSEDDGLEMHFAVNVRSPWRLALALLPALKAASTDQSHARVINVTGGEEKPGPIDIDNLQAEQGFKGLMTYGHSKSVNEAMSMALSKKLEPDGVTVNVVFPGQASTSMTQSLSFASLPGLMKLFYPIFWLLFRDDGGKGAQKAATSTIWAVTTTDLDPNVTGKFFDSKVKEQTLHPTAYDATVQERIIATIEAANTTSK